MKTIDAIVEGGKATAGPPLAPALAPMGVNIGQVVAKINEATKGFTGMKVPVKVNVDPKTKAFTVEVGSPPLAEILKKEIGIEKGAGNREAPAGNISMQGVVKVAQMMNKSLGKSTKERVKELLGTCVSMGVNVDGKKAKDITAELEKGNFDSMLKG
ncbi:50S ribosomal protein L11 [Candidatus Micrarchaeota archaeon]|nr:50S ribosomal protein L11 [Candidatus Micrarchaeota archaeon]